jgi:hypothetical protein
VAPMVQVGWACLKGAHEHSVQARNTSGRWKTAACHGAACTVVLVKQVEQDGWSQ